MNASPANLTDATHDVQRSACLREDFYGPVQLCNMTTHVEQNRRIEQHRCQPMWLEARRVSSRPASTSACPTRRFESTRVVTPSSTVSSDDAKRTSQAAATQRGWQIDLESELLRQMSAPSEHGTLSGHLAPPDAASGAPPQSSSSWMVEPSPVAIRQRWVAPVTVPPPSNANCLDAHAMPPLCDAAECPRGAYVSCSRPALFCNTCPNATRRSDELLTWAHDLPETRAIQPTWSSFPYELEDRGVARDARCGCAVSQLTPCQDAFWNQTRRKLLN